MKQFKEYSATHSMSTSWFAIDEDGNVAILNFDENGPVPCPPYPLEQSPESLIEYGGDERYGFKTLNYTEEQALAMFREFPEGFDELFNSEEQYFFDFVQIDVKRTDEFLSIIAPIINNRDCDLVCFNSNVGIYNLDGVKENKMVFENLKSSGIIVKVLKLNVDYDFIDDEEESEKLTPIPFFVYNQDYSDPNGDLEKVYTPTMPSFKEEQLSDIMRKTALRFKGKFSGIQHIQPSSALPFKSYKHLERRIVNGQVYYRMRLTGNSDEEAYVYDSMLSCERIDIDICRQCPIYLPQSYRFVGFLHGEELTNHPTIGLVIDGERHREYEIMLEDPDWVYRSFLTSAIHCHDAFDESAYNETFKLCQKVGDKTVFSHCRVYFERVLNIFKPYVLVLSDVSCRLLMSAYVHSDSHILIAGERYPYFALNEVNEHKEEILNYASQPYRGKVIPKILSVDEAERIGVKVER